MYLGEFRSNYPHLLAAMAGMGVGAALSHCTMGLFDVKNFSLLLRLLNATLGLGASAGSLILSLSLEMRGDYFHFMLVSAVATLLGAVCFASTGGGLFKRAPAGASANPRKESQNQL